MIGKLTTATIRIAFVCLFILTTSVSHKLWATHLRAGEITVERVDCSGLTFRITITVYTDTGSEVRFGEGLLDFGDGSDPFALPIIENNLIATVLADGSIVTVPADIDNLGDQVAVASLSIEHTYSSAGRFNIGYIEPNRNEGVLNIDNSVNTTFFVETQINIDPFLGCNNTPILLIPPIDRGCTSAAFFHNPGAFDPDGDSIAFELVVPKKELDVVVDGYEPLNDRSFYENFGEGNETRDGEPTFFIDPITGEIEWNAPGRVGEYNIAFIVKEYRKIRGEFFLLGFVTRDMQIIVEDCDNERPELIIPEDICVEAGTIIDETIFGIDADNDQVKIEAFSQVFDFGATISPEDSQFQPSVPPAELQFRWETECLDVRDQPYQVVFKITDNPPMGPRLVSFATWNITVIGPKPVITAVEEDGQALRINWDSYICQNAELIQLWRRVDENPYMPDSCETGIRANAGYTMITELPVTATTFRDTNLAAAAKYCYRLVAIFPQPAGGESVVSDEVCFEFVPAEEPVITHVSVRRTDRVDGEVVVAWREPFELGSLTLPYVYKIERAVGLNGGNFAEVGMITDNIGLMDSIGFVDSNINTTDNAFSYRIGIVDPSGSDPNEIIYSATASSVRLAPTPRFGQIELNWTANVPWSNTIATSPDNEHLIFRGFEGDTEADLELIATVDVTQFGFTYTDTDVDDELIYCYRILTKGTYGNPDIRSPLLNFSQVVCAQPSDSIPPCAPVLSLELRSCEEFFATASCDINDFSNQLDWTTEFVGDCQNDVGIYQVWYAPTTDAEFAVVAEVPAESFLHDGLTSFKGCYKIRAIDRSGNESEFSNTVCVDNCPNYVLPNVFTPGNGDDCNDLFSAFSGRQTTSESGSNDNCGAEVDPAKCARFVESVEFTVFNRWGGQVYSYVGRAGSENGILIDWDGRGDNGRELSSGVYYYLANVRFDVVDPANANQQIKGWIQIIR